LGELCLCPQRGMTSFNSSPTSLSHLIYATRSYCPTSKFSIVIEQCGARVVLQTQIVFTGILLSHRRIPPTPPKRKHYRCISVRSALFPIRISDVCHHRMFSCSQRGVLRFCSLRTSFWNPPGIMILELDAQAQPRPPAPMPIPYCQAPNLHLPCPLFA
jgi:hypothetical protein